MVVGSSEVCLAPLMNRAAQPDEAAINAPTIAAYTFIRSNAKGVTSARALSRFVRHSVPLLRLFNHTFERQLTSCVRTEASGESLANLTFGANSGLRQGGLGR